MKIPCALSQYEIDLLEEVLEGYPDAEDLLMVEVKKCIDDTAIIGDNTELEVIELL